MSAVFWIVSFFSVAMIMVACQPQQVETMDLLEEKIGQIKISPSNGIGDMNQEVTQSIDDQESLDVFEKAIRTAVKQSGMIDQAKPDYDIMVKYETDEGELPTHGIHLWLGKENENSMFMYLTDDPIYLTSPQMTQALRRLILSE